MIGGSRLTKLKSVDWFALVVSRVGEHCAGYPQLALLDEKFDAKGVDDGTGIECLAFMLFSGPTCLEDASVKHVSTEPLLLPSIFLFLVHAWGLFGEGDLDGCKFPLMMFGINSSLFVQSLEIRPSQ